MSKFVMCYRFIPVKSIKQFGFIPTAEAIAELPVEMLNSYSLIGTNEIGNELYENENYYAVLLHDSNIINSETNTSIDAGYYIVPKDADIYEEEKPATFKSLGGRSGNGINLTFPKNPVNLFKVINNINVNKTSTAVIKATETVLNNSPFAQITGVRVDFSDKTIDLGIYQTAFNNRTEEVKTIIKNASESIPGQMFLKSIDNNIEYFIETKDKWMTFKLINQSEIEIESINKETGTINTEHSQYNISIQEQNSPVITISAGMQIISNDAQIIQDLTELSQNSSFSMAKANIASRYNQFIDVNLQQTLRENSICLRNNMYIKYIVKNISDLYNEESKICNYELTESILATAVTVGNCDKTKLECKIIKNTMDGFTSNAAEIGKADSTAYLSGTVTKFTEFNYAITDVLYTYTIASEKTTPFGKIPAKVIKENIKIVWVNNPVFKIDFYDYVERSYEPANSNWSIYRHKHTIENGEIFNDISNTNDSFKFTFTNNNCVEMCVKCNLQVRGNFKFYRQLQEPLSDFVEESIDSQYTGYYILPFDISLLYPSLPCQMPLQFKSGSNIPYKVMYDKELDVLNDENLQIIENEAIRPEVKVILENQYDIYISLQQLTTLQQQGIFYQHFIARDIRESGPATYYSNQTYEVQEQLEISHK